MSTQSLIFCNKFVIKLWFRTVRTVFKSFLVLHHRRKISFELIWWSRINLTNSDKLTNEYMNFRSDLGSYRWQFCCFCPLPHSQLRPPYGGARLAMEGAKTTKMPPRSLIIIGSLNHYKTSIYLFDNLPESLLKLF